MQPNIAEEQAEHSRTPVSKNPTAQEQELFCKTLLAAVSHVVQFVLELPVQVKHPIEQAEHAKTPVL